MLGLILFASLNSFLVYKNQDLIKINGMLMDPVPDNERLYERWNSFSRILVFGDKTVLHRPIAWGLSAKWPQAKKVSELIVGIDSVAHTPLTQFNGDLHTVDHLQYDVVNTVHLIRPNSSVLIVGVGGGRDVLSSLYYHQKHILGIEVNDRILETLTGPFGDYTGHLDRYPQVQLVNDEARSFIARSQKKFDIIQVSLIDTFAATASGGFVFTENSLYTLESWKIFMEHLTSRGIFSVSRWYGKKRLGEIYRCLTLATTTLRNLGVEDPRRNIVIIASQDGGYGGRTNWNVGNLLVSKQPFSEEDLNILDAYAKEKGFQIVLSPRTVSTPSLASIVSTNNLNKLADNFPINILPPSDDSPFFFHMLKLKNFFNPKLEQVETDREYWAVLTLWFLFIVVLISSFCFILFPVLFSPDRRLTVGTLPLLIYFCSIGLGFMFIEISQMQRLIVFLGHPIYGLSVVLFTLLLGSAAGSYSVSILSSHPWLNKPVLRLGGLLIALILFGCLTSFVIVHFRNCSTFARISLSTIVLIPLGFFLGMAFPIGMNLGQISSKLFTPWLWGVNGAASVCASILALILSLNWGISATFWAGFAFYVVAFFCYLLATMPSTQNT